MKHTYVLDTSAIVSDPYCLDKFPNANIIIHTQVLSELDQLKTTPGEVGRNARMFIRILDELSNQGSISQGIVLENQSLLKIDSQVYPAGKMGDPAYTDNSLLACAESQVNGKKNPVSIVSQDINLRLRAKAFNLNALIHQRDKGVLEEIYSGIIRVTNEKLGNKLKDKKQIECRSAELKEMAPNQCVVFQDKKEKNISFGRKVGNKIHFVNGTKAWGIGAKNPEQAMALDLLMDPEVPLVSLAGLAGTGKTLLALASALECTLSQKYYHQILVYKPFEPVGKELGYMPGDLSQKLEVWAGNLKDCFDILMPRSTQKGKQSSDQNWISNPQFGDRISFEALTYIRGRSFNNTFVVVDEVQNLDANIIKTVLTRVGYNSKIVLLGDIEQIDANKLDALNNGLSHVIDKFKTSELSGHISLKEVERSALAEEAAKLL